nr:receptor-like protein 56 [Coffea arabica]
MVSGSISKMLSGSFNLMTLDWRYNKLSGGIPRYIGKLRDLRVLLFGGNELHGHIPLHLCQLQKLTITDLSQNKFSGPLPSCFSNISFGRGHFAADAFLPLDTIVTTLGNPIGLASLDLSYNNFSGEIPSELASLNFLSIFNVSYNNLSGRTPDTGEFANFDDSNYRGNPGLCGPLLKRSCNPFAPHPENVGDQDIEVDGAIDVAAFPWSFFASYMVIVIALVVLLFVSPYYRRACYSIGILQFGKRSNEFASIESGNRDLCGPLIKRSCDPIASQPVNVGGQDKEVDGVIDVVAFIWSSFASYVVIVTALAIILCISPYHRKAWSYYIDYWILSRFYEYCRSHSY